MYIKRLFLKNVRCFEEIEINLDQYGSSLLMVGDNGEGKSTILRSLAMGLCDESSAAALFRELPGGYVRRPFDDRVALSDDLAEIEIDLAASDDVVYRIVTSIYALETFERVSQVNGLYRIQGSKTEKLDQDSFPWEQIFVSGYGAGLRIQGTADFQHYLAVDAVYPLFRPDVTLQNPELAIRRLVDAAGRSIRDPKIKRERETKMLNTIKQLLAKLLDLETDDYIHLTVTGIEVQGPWGRAELGELGDGYRATVTWVLDLLAWWLLRASRTRGWQIKNIRGIVLIDEIEQHLHPRWQRNILSLLKKSFPKVQFIATTHSPLCAAGTADLGDQACQLVRLYRSNGAVSGRRIPLPRGFRADQILTSNVFNLPETRNPTVGKKVSRYHELLRNPTLSNKEKSELNRLRKFISLEVPEAGQFEEERKMRDELRSLIQEIEALKKK